MGDGVGDISEMTSQQVLCDPTEQKTRKRPGPSTLKVLKLSANSTSRLIFYFFSQSGYF